MIETVKQHTAEMNAWHGMYHNSAGAGANAGAEEPAVHAGMPSCS